MNFPKELKYTRTHEWIRFDGDSAYIGITDFAQDQLGDLVFVNLPEEGDDVLAGKPFADVESVKAVSDVNSPEKMNEDPYEAWFVKVGEISAQVELLDAEEYEAFAESEA